MLYAEIYPIPEFLPSALRALSRLTLLPLINEPKFDRRNVSGARPTVNYKIQHEGGAEGSNDIIMLVF